MDWNGYIESNGDFVEGLTIAVAVQWKRSQHTCIAGTTNSRESGGAQDTQQEKNFIGVINTLNTPRKTRRTEPLVLDLNRSDANGDTDTDYQRQSPLPKSPLHPLLQKSRKDSVGLLKPIM